MSNNLNSAIANSNWNKFFVSLCSLPIGFVIYKIYQNNLLLEKKILYNSKDIDIHNGPKEQKVDDLDILPHRIDSFNGIIINSSLLPSNLIEFEKKLRYSLIKWKLNNHRGCWLELPINLVSYISFAIDEGFKIHHARPDYIMFEKWLPDPLSDPNMIPDYCWTYLGVGCLVLNKNNQVIVIQEKWNPTKLNNFWKLPGGHIDRNENIMNAAIREAKEETGIDTEFISILGFRHTIPYQFGNTSDIYFLCLLKIIDDNSTFHPDAKEIDKIKWIDFEEYLLLDSHLRVFGHGDITKKIQSEVEYVLKNWNDPNTLQSSSGNSLKPCFIKSHNPKRTSIIYHA